MSELELAAPVPPRFWTTVREALAGSHHGEYTDGPIGRAIRGDGRGAGDRLRRVRRSGRRAVHEHDADAAQPVLLLALRDPAGVRARAAARPRAGRRLPCATP